VKTTTVFETRFLGFRWDRRAALRGQPTAGVEFPVPVAAWSVVSSSTGARGSRLNEIAV